VVLFGRSGQVTVMAAVLALACVAVRRWRGAVLVAVAVPAAGALTEFLLKPFVGRLLSGYLSYPSGHTTGVIALAVTFAVLLADPTRPRLPAAVRLLLAALAVLAAGAVALAVVGLGLHYFTDTVGGAATGTAVVLLTALIIDSAADLLHRAHHRGSRAKPGADAPTTGAPLASYLSRGA
jgi:membrane-associated phospholipid phosphatase